MSLAIHDTNTCLNSIAGVGPAADQEEDVVEPAVAALLYSVLVLVLGICS